MLLRNARIVGGDDRPVDILLKRGVVTGIGVDSAGGALSGTAQTDLGGRWVHPGFWDKHVHFTQHALARRRVDVSSASSAVDAAAIMGAAERPPAGLPLVGYGFRDGLWTDAPSSALLDAVVPDVPVVVLSADLHCVWLNTAALVRYGFGGHPTGILVEDDAFPVTAAVQAVPSAIIDEWVADGAMDAARRGVVGVVDLEMGGAIPAWTRRFADGFRTLRVDAGLYTAELDAAIGAGLRTGQVVDGSDGLLRVGPYKVITDGSLNTRTAYCVEAYPGHPDEFGLLTIPTDRLVALLTQASEAGLSLAVHAIGDEANRLALDAFEAVGCGGRIEHAQLLRPEDIARFRDLGIVASVQPEHAMDDRDVADHHWAGRTERSFALKSLLTAGVGLELGSDAPVAPLDPWVTIAAAVTRTRDGRAPWHPEQAISTEEALAASTNGVAGVAVGMAADLAVLDADPLTATADQLRTLPVAATLLAGHFTHNAL
ncbi:amidohydrolase [Marisediminicola senii]|uniref:amidohydrolase n=1 Tax=Marisediminicola senii TaxID=2711233 RepID=UPI0013EB578E|nr:amidohydrolase family protein [Marisediminicola senii]